jgi:hypothetical protein
MSTKIIAVDELATSRMLGLARVQYQSFHRGCVALFVGQYCMGFVALTALALFRLLDRLACEMG